MARTKAATKSQQDTEASTGISSPPPSRPPRVKSIPNRFHFGIDKHIPGVPSYQSGQSSGSKSQTPSKRVSESAPEDTTGKAKEGMPPLPRKKQRAQRHKETSTATSNPSQSSPIVPDALSEIYHHNSAPPGFTTENHQITGDLAMKFKDTYSKKVFCPVVSVDLEKINQNCSVDLSPWLKPYEPFLSITAQFSANITKMFYFNMEWDNLMDNDNNLVEERVSTQVRGVKFTLSATIINEILKISNPPPPPTEKYSNRKIFEILRPNESIPNDQLVKLSFAPMSMPPLHRVLWYIYSRNMIQKGGNFTHFANKDYTRFALLVNKVPINLGHWIFQEMVNFKFSSRKPAHIPFPSLVSVILFYHKIWYVGAPDSMKAPTAFGKAQLHLMRISFEAEGSDESHAPHRSRAQEAQSATQSAPPLHSVPPDFGLQVQAIVDKAFQDMMIRIQSEVNRLCSKMEDSNSAMIAKQDEMSSHLIDHDASLATLLVSQERMDARLTAFINRMEMRSSSGFGSPTDLKSEPSASPSFGFTTPPIPTTASPSSPHTVILPTPISSPIPTPSPAPTVELSTPITDPSISAPSSFVDDKGGEEPEKEVDPKEQA